MRQRKKAAKAPRRAVSRRDDAKPETIDNTDLADARPLPGFGDVRARSPGVDNVPTAGLADPRGPGATGGVDVGTPNISDAEARTNAPQSADARDRDN